jgi:hypothetical protein
MVEEPQQSEERAVVAKEKFLHLDVSNLSTQQKRQTIKKCLSNEPLGN